MTPRDALLIDGLTPQELVVLRRLGRLGTNRQIARDLFVSVNTVKSHVAHIYMKLGVANRATAVARANDLGLLGDQIDISEGPDADDTRADSFVVTSSAVRTYWSELVGAIHARDWSAFERLHRPDACWVGPTSIRRGVLAMAERMKEIVGSTPDWHLELTCVALDRERNRAMVECVQTGTHSGALRTLDATLPACNRSFRFLSVIVLTFDDSGLVSEIRAYWDFLELLRELGLRADIDAP